MINKISTNTFLPVKPQYKINNCSFKGIQNQNAFVNRDLSEQADSIISAFFDMQDSLGKLKQMKNKELADSLAGKSGKRQFLYNDKTLLLSKGNTKLVVKVTKDRGISVVEINKTTGKTRKNIFLKDRRVAVLSPDSPDTDSAKFLQNPSEVKEIEGYLKQIFDDVDYELLCLRKNIRKNAAKAEEKCTVAAVVPPELVKDVTNSLLQIKQTLRTQAPQTRVRIRNEYPLIKKNERGSQAFEFTGIGPSGEDMSVNSLAYNNEKLLVIKITQKLFKDSFLVINDKGEILKQHLNRFHHNRKNSDIESLPEYPKVKIYNNANFTPYLEIMDKELKKYNDFLVKRINQKDEQLAKFSTGEIGTVQELLPLIDTVFANYKQYKTDINAIKETQPRLAIKKKMGFESKMGQPSLILRKITPEKEHLFISFPTINNERCTKIILLDEKDNIKKTFLVQGDKLIKFEAKNIHRSKSNQNGFYYHSQEYIDNSGLKDYLEMINKKLKRALKEIKKERTNKTAS